MLANGMRYAIRHNATPENTAVVRLVFDVGSVAENEQQRGIAHFIEHMAFNGTTHVPEGEMVRILERYGLAFGADTNAYTSFDRTGYTLDLPLATPELLDKALFLMRETASEILFDPDAIDRERGVILSEKRTRDTYALKSFENRTQFLLPDSKIASRLPIGTSDIIRTAPEQTFRDFYEHYYTPGRATLVIVGNVDVDAVEAEITATFADWSAKFGEAPDPGFGSFDPARQGLSNEFTDPAVGETVSLGAFAPYVKRPDTVAERRANLKLSMGYAIIARRVARVSRAQDAPFTSASFSSGDIFELVRQTSLSVSARDGELSAALPAAEKIVRTALTYGFTDAEIAEQLANYRTAQENASGAASTRRNAALAGELVDAALTGQVVTTPESSLKRFEAATADVDAESVLSALRADVLDLGNPLVHVTSKTGLAGGAETIRAAYLASRAEPVSKPGTASLADFAYTDFGPPGQIVDDAKIADLDIRTVTFANNVRLNIKHTEFEKDRVRISLRIDGGDLLDTAEAPYGTLLMNIFAAGGLEAHSLDDLQTLLAGRSVAPAFGGGTDYFGTYVKTTSEDAELQLQVLAAYTTAPGYREEAVSRYRGSIANFFARLGATPEAALKSQLGAILSDDDTRFSLAPRQVYEQASFADLKSVLSDRLKNGAIEIGVVGDIQEDEAIALVARTFGALPAREANFRPYSLNRQRLFTRNRSVRYVHHSGEENQAVLQLYWPTDDDSDYQRTVTLRVLSAVLQLRLTDRLREELGASYAPSALSFASSIYPDYGYISVGSSVDYADRNTVYDMVMDIVRDLATAPPSRDEIDRARNPILAGIRNSRMENSTWANIVDEAQSEPRTIERFRLSEQAFQHVSTSDIVEAARTYLMPQRALRIESVHKSKPPG